jgi:hypothetical protein
MTVYKNYDVIAFKSCIQIFTVRERPKFLLELTYQYVHYIRYQSFTLEWMARQQWQQGSSARQCRAVPAFSVALVLPSLYYIEAEVESGCYCNEDTMCSIQPLLGACKKFCSHTTTTTTSSEYLLFLLQAGWVFNLLEILWDKPNLALPIQPIYIKNWAKWAV